MSNVGKWDHWYGTVTDPEPYGDTVTYELGAAFLERCELVEDWGCGKGWFSKFVAPHRYVGIDGSHSPFATKVVDLATYRSMVPGIFMRHVLEHNYEWRAVLDNALASFTQRMVLVVFTPFGDETREIAYADDPGVPDISFRENDLTERFYGRIGFYTETIEPSATQYGTERIFYLERSST